MNMRIGGLASGMDIDQLVNDLIRAERTRVDKVAQNREFLIWRQEAYQAINRLFANFILDTKKEFGLSRTTASGVLLSNSVNSLDWVKTATLTNEKLASVKVDANAVAGSYELKVHRLASNWSSASSDAISEGASDNLAMQFGLAETDTLKITITTNLGSVTIEKTDLSHVTINDIVKEINQADIGVVAMYDAASDRFFLQTKHTGSDNWVRINDESVLTDGEDFTNFINGKLKLQYLDGQVARDVADGVDYSGENALLILERPKGSNSKATVLRSITSILP